MKNKPLGWDFRTNLRKHILVFVSYSFTWFYLVHPPSRSRKRIYQYVMGFRFLDWLVFPLNFFYVGLLHHQQKNIAHKSRIATTTNNHIDNTNTRSKSASAAPHPSPHSPRKSSPPNLDVQTRVLAHGVQPFHWNLQKRLRQALLQKQTTTIQPKETGHVCSTCFPSVPGRASAPPFARAAAPGVQLQYRRRRQH